MNEKGSNPALNPKFFEEAAPGDAVMTLQGTLTRIGLLLLVTMGAAGVGWTFPSWTMLIISMIAGLGVALFTCFKPTVSPITAPIYAVIQGYLVGALSLLYMLSVENNKMLIPFAVLATFGCVAVMFTLYATRIIKVTQTYLMVVLGATLAIFVTFAASWILSIFWPAVWGMPIWQAGPIGIGFAAFVVIIAALNLAIDFKVIEEGVGQRAPKYMEWFAAFGLLVTIIWLYISILRLLALLKQ